jgi:hypothetical protein
VPDFTPVTARILAGGAAAGTSKLSAPAFAQDTLRAAKHPGMLGAPRYAHLLHEARTLGAREKTPELEAEYEEEEESMEVEEVEMSIASEEDDTERSVSAETWQSADTDEQSLASSSSAGRAPSYLKSAPPPKTLGSRVKGFLFSYLPTRKDAKLKPRPKPRPAADGFPLPPPPPARPRIVVTPISKPAPPAPHPRELVELQRAPASTSRSASPAAHPRDLVDLEHVPTPAPSRLPRALDPKRLVELRHVDTPLKARAHEPRPRRSSGSVKDLVRAFEEGGQTREQERARALVTNDKAKVGRLESAGRDRPAWR